MNKFDGREALRAFTLSGVVLCIALMLAIAVAFSKKARGQDAFPNCAGWISHSCCCTNDCCTEVQAGEVEAVDGDHYRIIASGQVIARTGWSKDGRFMRCACDSMADADGTYRWVKHPKAHTRCIYPPFPST